MDKEAGGSESGSAVIRTLREQLGRELTRARAEAGWSQSELARRIGYSRSTVSTEESGRSKAHAARSFWQRCDQALRTGNLLATGFDRIREKETAGRRRTRPSRQRPVADGGGWLQRFRQAGQFLNAAAHAEALRCYAELGWHVVAEGDRLELETGTLVDALELPRVAGMLAAHWWLHSLGVPDVIRGLPTLPHPREALSVIAAGPRLYFLAQAGSCPWEGAEMRRAAASGNRCEPAVRWHAAGSRIPLPPGRDAGGQRAEWLYFSTAGSGHLAMPVALLDLLAKAAAGITTGTHIHNDDFRERPSYSSRSSPDPCRYVNRCPRQISH